MRIYKCSNDWPNLKTNNTTILSGQICRFKHSKNKITLVENQSYYTIKNMRMLLWKFDQSIPLIATVFHAINRMKDRGETIYYTNHISAVRVFFHGHTRTKWRSTVIETLYGLIILDQNCFAFHFCQVYFVKFTPLTSSHTDKNTHINYLTY